MTAREVTAREEGGCCCCGGEVREVMQWWEMEKFRVLGERLCREGMDGKVWIERLVWRVVVVLLLLS